jgi:hypothetical protein
MRTPLKIGCLLILEQRSSKHVNQKTNFFLVVWNFLEPDLREVSVENWSSFLGWPDPVESDYKFCCLISGGTRSFIWRLNVKHAVLRNMESDANGVFMQTHERGHVYKCKTPVCFWSDNVSKHSSVVGHVYEHVVISQHTSCNISKAGGHQLMPLKHGFQQKGFITWKPFDILGKNLGKL